MQLKPMYRLNKCLLLVAIAISSHLFANIEFSQSIDEHYFNQPICDFGSVRFFNQYQGARLSQCKQVAPDTFSLATLPEFQPINLSPWYSFKVASQTPKKIVLYINAPLTHPRYLPKISTDGLSFFPLTDYEWIMDSQVLKFELSVNATPLMVSAQPVVISEHYKKWIKQLEKLPYVSVAPEKKKHAESVFKQHMHEFVISEGGKEWMVIVGRQHPPEVTGFLGMHSFINRVASNSELAKRFRKRFSILVFPLANPDGVAMGNWRTNARGIDLNRDWIKFSQPETTFISQRIHAVTSRGKKIAIALDFHSTNKSIFYPQRPEWIERYPALLDDWLTEYTETAPGKKIRIQPSKTMVSGIFKNFITREYGAPAVTYEIGDEIPPALIKERGQLSADILMKKMLELAK